MIRLRRDLLELWIVLRSVWWNVALFLGLILAAAVLLEAFGCYPNASFHEQVVAAFYMARLESVSGSDHHLLPSILAFVMPLLTILILGEGVLRVAAIYLGRKEHRVEWEKLMVKTLSGHVVLCGAGELGRAFLRELLERDPKREVVVVDYHVDILEELGMQGDNLHHIHGDMTSQEILVKANVAAASTLIIASGDDAINLETAVKAFRLNPEAETWIRLYRSGLSDIMDIASRPNFHFFSPYIKAAKELADLVEK